MGVFTVTMEKQKRDMQQEIEKVNKSIEKQIQQNEQKITKQEQKQALRGVLYQYLYNYFQDNIITWIVDTNINNIYEDLKKLKTMYRITAELGENACEREYLLSVYDRELKKVYKLILQEKEERWDELTEEQRNNAYKQNMQISMERMQQGFANVRKMSMELNDEIYRKGK